MKTIIFCATILSAVFWGRYDETYVDRPTCIDTYGNVPVVIGAQYINTAGINPFPNNFKILFDREFNIKSKKDGC